MPQPSVQPSAGPQLKKSTLVLYGAVYFPMTVIGLPLLVYIPPLYGELGLSLATLGTVMLVARLFDVLTDPLIGVLSDRTRSALGRRKPWMLAGTPLMIASTYLLFVPPGEPSVAYFAMAIFLIYLAYTMVGLPYLSWGAELATTYRDRSRVTAWREQFGLMGTLLALALPMLLALIGTGDLRTVVFYEALVVCIVMPIVVVASVIGISSAGETVASRSSVSPLASIGFIARNGPFKRVLIGYSGSLLGASMDAATSYFFCKHLLNLESWYAVALFSHILFAVAGVPLWNRIGYAFGKHRALVGAICWYAAWAFAMPLLTLEDLPQWVVIVGFVGIQSMKGLSAGAFEALSSSMAADVIDIDQGRTGLSRPGLYFSIWGMVKKMSAVAAFFALVGLESFGFDATADPNLARAPGGNTATALMALTVFYSFIPSCLKLSVVPVLWRYPLTEARQQRLRERIARRAVALNRAA